MTRIFPTSHAMSLRNMGCLQETAATFIETKTFAEDTCPSDTPRHNVIEQAVITALPGIIILKP
jgi:hypothetical protein